MPDKLDKLDLGILLRMEPAAVVDYFRAKGYAISWDWQEVLNSAHARAFTVAKATSLDVLTTIQSSVVQAIATGMTQREFSRQLMPELKKLGWWGQTTVTHENGEEQTVTLGSPRRLETIYRTNMTTAYQAGRYLQQLGLPERPYWQYIAVMDERTRANHAAMNGLVFAATDPIWLTHYPPNDWGCRCRVRAMSKMRLDANGLSVSSSGEGLTTSTVEFGKSVATGEVYETEVTTFSRTINGQTVTMTPGAGWSYNVGAAAFGTDVAVAQKLVELESRSLRQAVIQSLNNAPARQLAFADWVANALTERRPGANVQPVAFMTDDVAEHVEARTGAPAARLMAIGEKQLLHADSPKHQAMGAALTLEEYQTLPQLLASPDAVLWDNKNNNLLYVVKRGEQAIKVAVNPAWKNKKQPDLLDTMINAYRVSYTALQDGVKSGEYEVLQEGLAEK
ncbi:phage minor head protein [Aeromonas enteropelogenes]|uniref:phage minor head protein n=1 Tax=Aeromonas enteropelogenes TaxID=29489 RepID=UPI003BA19C99